MNENENKRNQNLWDAAKAVLREMYSTKCKHWKTSLRSLSKLPTQKKNKINPKQAEGNYKSKVPASAIRQEKEIKGILKRQVQKHVTRGCTDGKPARGEKHHLPSEKGKLKPQNYHCIPIRMAKQKSDTTKSWQGCGETGFLTHGLWERKMVRLWKTVWQFLKKHATTIELSNCTSGHLSREMKNYVHRKPVTSLFRSRFIRNSQELDTPRVLHGKHKQAVAHSHHGASLNRNELGAHRTWIHLTGTRLSAKNQSPKVTYYVIPFK